MAEPILEQTKRTARIRQEAQVGIISTGIL